MYYKRKITDDIYYVGENDRRIERFENMFELPDGVAYNSYLILDQKTALLDGIDEAVSERYYENIRFALDGRDLDYLIVNHVEPDHCSSINNVLREYPNATMVITQKGLQFMEQFYNLDYQDRVQIVGEGDKLDLGKHQLEFIMAPNVHWPEVMVTYDHTDNVLFSADAFGSFKAIAGHLFADQVNFERDWLEEARRYYMNIVGRNGPSVMRLFKKLVDFDLKIIAPLHGVVFRTPEMIEMILDKYTKWATYEPEEPGVVLACASMYGDSQNMNDILAAMLADRGVPNIRVYDISKTSPSQVIADVFRFSNAVFTCLTYNTQLYPGMDALLREIAMLNYANRKISFLENQSWGGRALAIAQEILGKCKNLEIIGEPFKIKSSVAPEQMDELAKLADEIAASIE
ncbi:MAG: FprA family A-type flavoprotein [Clostridiaceae bacterium]|jgi:flavorubredoxin|nr:FprA family A-type flavoprotein [Bacillota bacterium]NLN52071.1 FprA family A-type flavoprotein [Clostridiaceae bacterium]